MASVAPRLLARNTGTKMLPTISQFKTSLSPSPSSFCSFSLVPSLWCATRSGLACQNTNKIIIRCAYRWPQSQKEQGELKGTMDEVLENHDKPESQIPEGKSREMPLTDPASTEQEGKYGETKACGDLNINVGLEIMEDGEYVMKIKRMTSSEGKDEVESAKQMAQNAAMLLLHAEMLREMGQKLFAQSRGSLRSIFEK